MIELREVAWDDPDADRLRAAQRDEVTLIYGRSDTEAGPHPTAADIEVFLVAYVEGEAAGCGAFRRRDDEHGEVKRMYVAPRFRGSGVSSAILSGLEERARARNWHRLVLETGHLLAPAIRFYEREGYVRVPLFPPYVDSSVSICFEKRLRSS